MTSIARRQSDSKTDDFNISYIISYHIVDLKRENRLKVGTDKPKVKVKKVKMQSVSDGDVRTSLLEKLRSEQGQIGQWF